MNDHDPTENCVIDSHCHVDRLMTRIRNQHGYVAKYDDVITEKERKGNLFCTVACFSDPDLWVKCDPRSVLSPNDGVYVMFGVHPKKAALFESSPWLKRTFEELLYDDRMSTRIVGKRNDLIFQYVA